MWRETVVASSTMNFPESQFVHVEAVEENFPEEQIVQMAAGASLDFPASQSRQAERPMWREAVLTLSVIYFPEGQFEQVDEEEVEYFPKEQMTQ
jgi:hypothetical protein